ncbi:transposase [Streptomyces niveus]|uniref:transposase n=1 Tax=Streptomyces niveus TaxID=193462 RepID=UPI0036E6C60A
MTLTGTSRSTRPPCARPTTLLAPGRLRRPFPKGAPGCRAQTRSDPGGTDRPAGGGGAGGGALGRSRGDFTTKLHLSAEGRCRVLLLVITPGQRADCTQFQQVMNKIRVPRQTLGRPRTRPDGASADKGYSNRLTRHCLRRRGIQHVIPEKADQAANRVRRGKAGGRPPGFDKFPRHRDQVRQAWLRLPWQRPRGRTRHLASLMIARTLPNTMGTAGRVGTEASSRTFGDGGRHPAAPVSVPCDGMPTPQAPRPS